MHAFRKEPNFIYIYILIQLEYFLLIVKLLLKHLILKANFNHQYQKIFIFKTKFEIVQHFSKLWLSSDFNFFKLKRNQKSFHMFQIVQTYSQVKK